MQTGQGTNNLVTGMKDCAARRGVSSGSDATGTQQTITGSVSKYTAEAHRALIAMHCAVNKRPFQSVADPLYIEEIKLLRPDVKVPSPRTVSRDINTIYTEASHNVKTYFEVRFLTKMQLFAPDSHSRNTSARFTLSSTAGWHHLLIHTSVLSLSGLTKAKSGDQHSSLSGM
ncbi:hypothetical protein DEU56DRAFT_747789 [Suillus clintonianus]|uniref:uncharacterized protein n=1 Tax=Suillus clintonianus TaxID=1904413 RepID=UPI001B8759E2|nr:uncharacterized protein DEU56DRAFT_747789 [Suillus clintonianus]KAG2118386.1 hypothetical protein DEU56DRAFT_747789 [Suillus clintonianus]